MSNINEHIDHATALMKQRAAEFDATRDMGPDDTALALLRRADRNFAKAAIGVRWTLPLGASQVIQHLTDTMNLCALAIARLEELR